MQDVMRNVEEGDPVLTLVPWSQTPHLPPEVYPVPGTEHVMSQPARCMLLLGKIDRGTEIKIYREIFVSRSIINEGQPYYQILLVTGPSLRYCNLRY